MDANAWSALQVEVDALTRVMTARIHNPPLSLLNQPVRQELGSLFTALAQDRSVGCLVLASGPRSFCAGADLREYPLRFDPAVARAHVDNAHRMIRALVELDTPSIAAIRGPCMGGGVELALGCSYRIAARSATLALPEVKRGAWPGTGGCALLARAVGPSRAKRLLYTGETLDADAACRFGLVDEVVDDDALDERAQELARAMADRPASSIGTMADLVDGEFRRRFRQHLEHEAECFVRAYQLPAAREGYQAFFEKREPRWDQSARLP